MHQELCKRVAKELQQQHRLMWLLFWICTQLHVKRKGNRSGIDKEFLCNSFHWLSGSSLAQRRALTWWARQMRSMSCLWRNFVTTSAPKVKETPRSFSPQPSTSLSGSAHSRSHSRPWSGTSVGRMTLRTCSIDWRSGDRPGGVQWVGMVTCWTRDIWHT